MTLARHALVVARDTLLAIARRLDSVLQPPEKPQPEMDREQAEELQRRTNRQVRLAGTRPWNYSRPKPIEIPESMRYLADTQGEKAVIDVLVKRSRRH